MSMAGEGQATADGGKDYTGERRRFVSVWRSRRHDGLYLYVDRGEGLERVPPALRERLGAVELALELVLTPERKLASADAREVLARIEAQGYYLQLPPAQDDYMREIVAANDKLLRDR